MELRRYLRIARHRWWIVVLATVIPAITAFAYSQRIAPIYEAESTLLLNLSAQPAIPTFQDVTASQALTKTYALLINAPPVLDEAARRIGGNVTEDTLAGVSGSSEPQTQLLYVRYQHHDPEFAAKVVNTVSEVYAERMSTAQLGEVAGRPATAIPSSVNTIFIAKPARVPTIAVFPDIGRNVILAALAGIIFSIGLIALLEYLDDTIKDPSNLQALELRPLGLLRQAGSQQRAQPSLLHPAALRSPLAEDFRQLRTSLEFVAPSDEVRSILVTSAQKSEGKTTVLCNLAVMLASTGRRVIVVDSDLRKPAVHRYFDVPNELGLTTAFLAPLDSLEKNIRALLERASVPNLYVLPSGPIPPNPAELLASSRMTAITKQLSSLADFILFDSPPMMEAADSSILAGRVDGALLVIHAGRTRPGAVRLAVERLRGSGVRVLGGVLNRVAGSEELDYQTTQAYTATQSQRQDGPASVSSSQL